MPGRRHFVSDDNSNCKSIEFEFSAGKRATSHVIPVGRSLAASGERQPMNGHGNHVTCEGAVRSEEVRNAVIG